MEVDTNLRSVYSMSQAYDLEANRLSVLQENFDLFARPKASDFLLESTSA